MPSTLKCKLSKLIFPSLFRKLSNSENVVQTFDACGITSHQPEAEERIFIYTNTTLMCTCN